MRNVVWIWLAIACTTACGDDAHTMQGDAGDAAAADGGGSRPSEAAVFYARDHLLEVELTLDDADWAKIREEGRTLEQVFSGCREPFSYTTVEARAVIDGEKVGKIGMRKKGYLGSLSVLRPSLHLDVAEYDPELRAQGQKTLVLNNSRQDPSFTHTCMAYDVFRKAGVPAPRCSFAHVTVNGEDLGTYLNVEPVKKPLLAELFGDDSGLLYEGTGGADFRDGMLDGFEQKTNETTPSEAPMQEVIDALAKSGSARTKALDAAIDVDEFLKFWATESLVSHWDGYSGDLNNFFIYERPKDSRLVFLPWGTDSAFEKDHAFLPEDGRPKSVFALAHLANVLYADDATRARYQDALREILDDAWDEDALDAQIDEIAAIVGDAALAKPLAEQRDFVSTRRDEMLAELDAAEAPSWPFGERPATGCTKGIASPASGTFSATWGSIDDVVASADTTLELTLGGTKPQITNVVTAAGNFTDPATGASAPAIRILAFLKNGGFLLVQLSLAKHELKDGARIPLHGLETSGYVASGTMASDLAGQALLSDGEIVFEKASKANGAKLIGSFTARSVPLLFN